MFILNIIGDWIGVWYTRAIVDQSLLGVLLVQVIGSSLWWVSLYCFKDWDDYRKLAAAMILGSLIGTTGGMYWPPSGP